MPKKTREKTHTQTCLHFRFLLTEFHHNPVQGLSMHGWMSFIYRS